VASAEGLVAAENAMGGRREMDYRTVPGAIFTSPEVADVGLTEVQAGAQGYRARSDSVLFRTLGKAQIIGDIAGQAKIVSECSSGRILGVHIIGPHATDLIAEATLAINLGAAVEDLSRTIHAHPTLAEIMLETALKAMDRPLHG
jgi:dihydrolipoamide dehydrogenase